MNKRITLIAITCFAFLTWESRAGNPDRQGESGAYELLLNPWGRSIGLHSMMTAGVRGVEAMSLNVAGLSRLNSGMEVGLSHSIYLGGTGLGVNSLGFATKLGETGTFGISLNAMDFGTIPVTTDQQPEGTGATFSPRFYNFGLSYAKTFEEKVSVGITVRLISESIADVSASGFSLDAGIQYMNGPKEYPQQFKFGVAVRNIGDRMKFGGQGLNRAIADNSGPNRTLTYSINSAGFQLPSQLYIGASYDVLPDEKNKVTVVANFTSNAFSTDNIGAGVEFSLNNLFQLRGGYKYEIGATKSPAGATNSVYTGVCAGASVQVPLNKDKKNMLTLDYGYLMSNPWNGTHNLSIKINL